MEIDGSKAAVTSGQVGVEGVVGSTRNVRLIYKGQQQDFVVAIAESGIVPSSLDLVIKPESRPAAARPAAARPAPAPGRSISVPPSVPLKEAKPSARASDLNRNIDEFDK